MYISLAHIIYAIDILISTFTGSLVLYLCVTWIHEYDTSLTHTTDLFTLSAAKLDELCHQYSQQREALYFFYFDWDVDILKKQQNSTTSPRKVAELHYIIEQTVNWSRGLDKILLDNTVKDLIELHTIQDYQKNPISNLLW